MLDDGILCVIGVEGTGTLLSDVLDLDGVSVAIEPEE